MDVNGARSFLQPKSRAPPISYHHFRISAQLPPIVPRVLIMTTRNRVLRACIRCKKRKRKCDGHFPCHACTKASAECDFGGQAQSPGLTLLPDLKHLECDQQIAKLHLEYEHQISQLKAEHEQRLRQVQAEHEREVIGLHGQIGLMSQPQGLPQAPQRSFPSAQTHQFPSTQSTQSTQTQTLSSTNESSVFAEILAKLMYNTADESHEYIGSFAVITIVKAIKKNLLGDDSEPQHHAMILNDLVDDDATIPSFMEKGFLDKFFSLSHNRYYIFDHVWFHQMVQTAPEARTEWDQFCLNIALGVGCRLNELLNVTTYPSPEVYLRRALKHLAKADMDEIKQIQGCMVMAIFITRSYHLSFYVSGWELVGIAMRKLVQYGYHRKQPVTRDNVWHYELIKRLFWSTYNCDKLLSLSLGRPFSTFDSFIDIPYPLSVNFPQNPTTADYDKLYELQLKQHQNPSFKQEISEFTTFVNTSVIRHIEGRIHLLLYSVTTIVPVADTFEGLLRDLNIWYHSLPPRAEFNAVMGGRERYEFLDLLYHRARLILLLPRIMNRIDHERIGLLDQACISAGGICSSYKELYRALILEFSIVALHSVFLAGITMVYYLKNRGEPEFMDIQSDIRACASLLFVFSERWNEAKTYSDLFDKILNDSTKRPQQVAEGVELLNSLREPQYTPMPSGEIVTLNEDFWDQILHDIKSSNGTS